MFSFQNSPIELGAVSASGQEIDGNLAGPGGDAGVFSAIMSDFYGHTDASQLEARLVKLQENGLPADQMQMLQQLLADVKTLPEAAEAVFAALQEQLAGLMESGQVQIHDIERIQGQMAVLAEILPDEIREQLSLLLADLQSVLAEHETQEEQGTSPLPLPEQQEKVEGSTQPEMAIPVLPDEIPKDRDTQKQRAFSAKLNDSKAFRSPVQFQENYGQLKEKDLQLDPSRVTADNKYMLNPANKLTSARINPVMVNDQLSQAGQAITSTATAIGGERGFGSMMSNGQNTSYTQLMSQSVPTPVTQNIHKPEWGGAVGERITWMIGNRLQSAQLRITPAHLGPIEIKLSIENNMAQVSFVSNHQVVRDALEQAAPRLKEMLEEQNLDLVNVDIGKGNNSGTDEEWNELADSANPSADSTADTDDLQGQNAANTTKVITGDGLIDAYA